MKMAVLADIHASAAPVSESRKGEWGIALVRRALDVIRHQVRPDAVLVMGDINNAGNLGQTPGLDDILALLRTCSFPVIAIPGNHDLPEQEFYRCAADPRPYRDIAGVRLAVFCDEEAPGYCATRLPREMSGMWALRDDGFSGPIVSVQHVPLLPETGHDSPYRYTNAAEILECMHDLRIGLAISGHYHKGVPLMAEGRSAFVVAPALCQPPFPFLEIDWDGSNVTVHRHELEAPGHPFRP